MCVCKYRNFQCMFNLKLIRQQRLLIFRNYLRLPIWSHIQSTLHIYIIRILDFQSKDYLNSHPHRFQNELNLYIRTSYLTSWWNHPWYYILHFSSRPIYADQPFAYFEIEYWNEFLGFIYWTPSRLTLRHSCCCSIGIYNNTSPNFQMFQIHK